MTTILKWFEWEEISKYPHFFASDIMYLGFDYKLLANLENKYFK